MLCSTQGSGLTLIKLYKLESTRLDLCVNPIAESIALTPDLIAPNPEGSGRQCGGTRSDSPGLNTLVHDLAALKSQSSTVYAHSPPPILQNAGHFSSPLPHRAQEPAARGSTLYLVCRSRWSPGPYSRYVKLLLLSLATSTMPKRRVLSHGLNGGRGHGPDSDQACTLCAMAFPHNSIKCGRRVLIHAPFRCL